MTILDRFILGLGYGATAIGLLMILSAFFVFLVSLASIFGAIAKHNEGEDE